MSRLASTINDIANKAGASVTSVSRVLNNKAGKYRISKETAKRILKAAAELDYKPNELARGLRLKKTHTIGLVIPDISNPFFAYVTRNIQRVAHELGYSLVVCDTDENLPLELEHINLLMSKGVDGLVIMPVGQDARHLKRLVKESVPLVLVDRCFDELDTSSVVVDNYAGAFTGIEHLLECGHRRIAIIQGLANTYSNTGRVQGYTDALKKFGIRPDPELIFGGSFREETGYNETKRILSMSERPTAIFATSDLITLGALQAINEMGLDVPNDISVLAFDDTDFAPFLKCPLTVIAQPKESMGEIAVKLLVDQIKGRGKQQTQKIILKPNLVKRNSVKRLVQKEVAVAHA
ncbi:MAG: LacI family DNA-binding transcriptional regulator [Ignavibacteriales bacterium]|nr:LacI family DNA-binding transcriptional regulator [Ignavibacteriales bacterium]